MIITGVKHGDQLGAGGFCAADGTFSFHGAKHLDRVFYGTGDSFASAMMGAMLCGRSTGEAIRIAVDFTHVAMEKTLENGLPLRYGAAFEQALPMLMRSLNLLGGEA